VSSSSGRANSFLAALPDVDILINNAGIFEPKDFFEIPDEDWSRFFFEVNVMFGAYGCRALISAGHAEAQTGAGIVFISSEIRAEHPDRDDPLRA